MSLSLETMKKWRWDLIGVSATALLVRVAATSPSAYFLQIDTAAQDFMALAWTRGCWEVLTEKIFPVLLLAPLFKMFGPSPYWETFLLAIAATISTATAYELSRLISGSKLAGIIAVLLILALPALQFYNRTYFGYLIPCSLVGWLAAHHRRWGWAGLSFGLVAITYFVSLPVAGLSVLAVMIIYLRRETWRNWLVFISAGILPSVIVEALFFFYMGHIYPFIWTRLTFGLIWRLSGITKALSHSNWLWLIQTTVGSNGWVISILLTTGLLAPFVLRRHKTGLAFSLTSLSIGVFYLLQAGLGRAPVVPRMLAASYPFWAISASVVLARGTTLAPPQLRRATAGLMVIGLWIAALQTSFYIREFTQTVYPQLEQWFIRAAQEHRPVRYQGNVRFALFFSQIYGVETLVNDKRWITDDNPEQAVLIFSSNYPPHLSSDNLSRDKYIVTVAETNTPSDLWYPDLASQAETPRRFELWWPTSPSKTPIKPDTPPDAAHDAAIYYSGSGCLTPPVYSDGDRPRTLHFYQLVWKKITGTYGK